VAKDEADAVTCLEFHADYHVAIRFADGRERRRRRPDRRVDFPALS